MKPGTRWIFVACLIALIGCKPPLIYKWGNYETSLYKLSKDPTSLQKYGDGLSRQIADGEATHQVPPGIYAEYGYFLLSTSHPVEAIGYFEKEKKQWPESTLLMDKMIKNCRGNQTSPSAVGSTSAKGTL